MHREPNPRVALILGALLILALERLVPMGGQILYPFTLLSTWTHEMGHGVTALLCGGRFERLDIFSDASGIAHFALLPGFRQALAAAGGLLGPPLVGALFLLFSRRAARLLLLLLAGAMLLSLPLWVRTGIGWLSVGGLGLGLVLLTRVLGKSGQLFLAQLVGLLLSFDTLSRGDYLFMKSALVGGRLHPSDVTAIAQVMGGPPLFWGGVVAALSALFIAIGLYAALRSGRKEHDGSR